MTSAIVVNGRFLTQGLTGVQRFAAETTRALQAVVPVRVLTPPSAPPDAPVGTRRVGWLGGHAWEQLALGHYAGDGVLLNLGNTAPLLRRRQVVVIHDAGTFAVPAAYSWRFRAWYRLLHGGLVRGGATIATVSAFARDDLARHLGADPADISVLGEGAEHILRHAADATLHARLGLLRPYVLAVGSLAAHKNLAALGALATVLAARGMDLVLTGALNPAVFGRAALPQPARLIGRVDDAALRALYQQATCFVLPSRYEGFGLPAIEAMACFCPVVAARAGALPEVCGPAALFCDPDDPGDIAAAVLRVLDEPALAAQLRSAGAARAAEFTWERTAHRLLALVAARMAGEPAA